MKSKSLFIKAAHMIFVMGVLAGCAGLQVAEPEKPPLRVEWTYWDGDYTLLVALEKGFFEKNGVKVAPIYYPNFCESVPDLAAGKLDGGLFAVDDLINTALRTPIKGVYVYDSGGTNTVISTPEVQAISDFRGKRVGFTPSTGGELFVQEMMALDGLSLRDITVVDLDPKQVPDALGTSVDAAYVWEPYASQALDKGNRTLYENVESPVGSITPDVIVFRQSILDDRPEDVSAFVRAWIEALEYRKAYPDETLAIASKHLGEQVELSDERLILFGQPENQALFGIRSNNAIPRTIYEILDTYLKFLINSGAITRPPDLKDLVDPAFLPDS